MTKKFRSLNGAELVIDAEYLEYAVVYDFEDDTFTTEPTADYDEARLQRAALQGQIVVRTIFETAWADVPPDHKG